MTNETMINNGEMLTDVELDNVVGGEGRPQPAKTREMFQKIIDWVKELF